MGMDDSAHALDLLLCYARDSSERSRKEICSWFGKSEFNESWLEGDQIVALDALEKFLEAAKIIGTNTTPQNRRDKCLF
jgi:hypothetical protein